MTSEPIRASIQIGPQSAAFYGHVMQALETDRVPFLIGGAFAFEVYTDIGGRTKDLDLFMKRGDVRRALRGMRARGYDADLAAEHWLGKIRLGDAFVDVIFGSGNGVAGVDDGWFEHARPAEVLGHQVKLIPIEEMLWSRAFIMERERYDGADVAHLIRAAGRTLDWRRLLDRFDRHWPVLLAHVVLFDFVYPSERARIPEWVRAELFGRAAEEPPDQRSVEDQVCYGPILSHIQYQPDLEAWGFTDGRLQPYGRLTRREIERERARLVDERLNGH